MIYVEDNTVRRSTVYTYIIHKIRDWILGEIQARFRFLDLLEKSCSNCKVFVLLYKGAHNFFVGAVPHRR